MAGLTVATATAATQPATRKRKQEVLDEDEWTEMLEQIVSRDFFPDVPKLENKLEWLQVELWSCGSQQQERTASSARSSPDTSVTGTAKQRS